MLVFEPTFEPGRSTSDFFPPCAFSVIVTCDARFRLAPKLTNAVVPVRTGLTVAVPVRVTVGAGLGAGAGVGGGADATGVFDVTVAVLFAGVGSTSTNRAVAVSRPGRRPSRSSRA